MATRGAYLVVSPDLRHNTRFIFNKRDALRFAKRNGAHCYAMPYQAWKPAPCPGDITTGWDTPTFCALATCIHPRG